MSKPKKIKIKLPDGSRKTIDPASFLSHVGMSEKEVKKWKELHFTVKEASLWNKAGFNYSEASSLKKSGIDITKVSELLILVILEVEADLKSYIKKELPPEAIVTMNIPYKSVKQNLERQMSRRIDDAVKKILHSKTAKPEYWQSKNDSEFLKAKLESIFHELIEQVTKEEHEKALYRGE